MRFPPEDVGDFPDKNIGEALQRVPGVQINRQDGEGAQRQYPRR